ncbi:MAG: threonylcarbamoyl-AMP synthase [Candidatus Adiutrix sp.]|jgi:L-threonylcarbamoyladenylate synthase|nr:threonylcarbamoyl-AMP synthase [Candidatus Adiutrix sp.]
MAKRLSIDPQRAACRDLAPAARTLLDGGVVAGPTGTFYGLMSLVDNAAGLERIAGLKGEKERQGKTFLILLDQEARVHCYAREVPPEAGRLMAAFWPGPLTLLFMAQGGLCPGLVGPARTVGLRVEELPAIRLLVRMADRGLTGTSANPAGAPPAETADQVEDYFGKTIDLIIDGGPTPGGQPSTIIDVSPGGPRVLREGALPMADLARVCPALGGDG